MFKKILSFIRRVSFSDVILFLCLFLCVLSFSSSRDNSKRIDVLEKRITVIEEDISSSLKILNNKLDAIDVHLSVLDKYASADWQHYFGIEVNNNIESKTKSKKK